MDLTAWALYAFIAAVALGGAVLHYRLREPAGRGRNALAVLRGLVLAVLVLILFDPTVPAGVRERGGETVVLLDVSASMALPTTDGFRRWDEARGVVEELEADRVLAFGAGEAALATSLDSLEPDAAGTRLAGALRAAMEAGARRVVVVTDGGVEDAFEARRLAGAGGTEVVSRLVGENTVINLGITEVDAPGWLETESEGAVRFSLGRVGVGVVPESATVVLRRDGRELGRTRVPVPEEGRTTSAEVRFTPGGASSEMVRLDLALEPGGSMTADDHRTLYVRVSDEPAGVTLVSFRPGQEPRFLLPVLERALGIPVQGWLALPGGRFIRIGAGEEAGRGGDPEAVRRAINRADLVVLHGLTDGAPGWARSVAAGGSRVLVFPGESWPSLPWPETRSARTGDWYVSDDLPPSPISAILAGVETGDVPPLMSLWVAADGPSTQWAAVHARLNRRGEPEPVLVAGSPGNRRVAVAVGEGYWRWAFDGPEGRELYDRLWSAVTAWLLEDGVEPGDEAVRPVDRVVARGGVLIWAVPTGTDSVWVRLVPEDTAGALPQDTVIPAEAGRARMAAPPPGHYRYEARTGTGESGEGGMSVESYSPELTRGGTPLDFGGPGTPAGAGGTVAEASAGAGRPLHATPWPYAMVVMLLCTEWVLRRRWGLR